jgi:OmpA-OmpF porin, OOP family
VGAYPIGTSGFAPYAKLGFYRAKTDASSNVGASASKTNTDWTAGLGVRYDFTKNLAVRAEWQRYNSVGGGDIAESDIDVLSIGALWKF